MPTSYTRNNYGNNEIYGSFENIEMPSLRAASNQFTSATHPALPKTSVSTSSARHCAPHRAYVQQLSDVLLNDHFSFHSMAPAESVSPSNGQLVTRDRSRNQTLPFIYRSLFAHKCTSRSMCMCLSGETATSIIFGIKRTFFLSPTREHHY
jgi:hypothetical protein